MARLSEFVFNHWLLVVAFALVLVAIIYEEAKKKLFSKNLLTTQQLVDMMNKETVVLLDVRESKKFKSGHIVHSLNVPVADLTKKLASLSSHVADNVVIIAETDADAEKVSKTLSENNFTKIFILDNGINAWKKDNYPLITK